MKIIIVGAGIAGLSTAWALVKRGHAVTLFEQGAIPNPLAASGDHHRIIRRAYPAGSGYGAAITEAYEAWEEMWRSIGGSHLDARGFLAISREAGDEAEIYRNGLDEGGWSYELMDGKAVAARHPFLDPASIRYAYFSTEGGALHCRKIAADLATWLRVSGCHIRDWTKITAIDPEHGKVHLANGDDQAADLVIVTAGAWVTKLAPDLKVDLTTYRTAVVYLDPPSDLKPAWAAAPVILDVGGKTDGYIIPESGTGGLKFGSGLHKRLTDDADADRAPEPGEGETIR
ncbi:MAG TPA: FAD-dependent oxidoreductase, partial [Rhizobiaceae bacterium]|nr:FAD-dependent oxidoreductase [Rhizobiaceae bacterium]